jgi:hypothetical protein
VVILPALGVLLSFSIGLLEQHLLCWRS